MQKSEFHAASEHQFKFEFVSHVDECPTHNYTRRHICESGIMCVLQCSEIRSPRLVTCFIHNFFFVEKCTFSFSFVFYVIDSHFTLLTMHIFLYTRFFLKKTKSDKKCYFHDLCNVYLKNDGKSWRKQLKMLPRILVFYFKSFIDE